MMSDIGIKDRLRRILAVESIKDVTALFHGMMHDMSREDVGYTGFILFQMKLDAMASNKFDAQVKFDALGAAFDPWRVLHGFTDEEFEAASN